MNDLEIALRAKVGVIWIVSPEELRVKKQVISTVFKLDYKVFTWSCTEGIRDVNGETTPDTEAPDAAIKHVLANKKRSAFIFHDLEPFVANDPVLRRWIKDLAKYLPLRERDSVQQVIVIDPKEPPREINALVIRWKLPTREEITQIIDSHLNSMVSKVKGATDHSDIRDATIDAAVGLSEDEISIALAKTFAAHKRIEPKDILKEKQQAIRGSGLEWYEPDPRGLDGIGGLAELKNWLMLRHAGLTSKGREYGLPAPRGVLLLGISGGGKSLTAKAVSTAWSLPLLRMDIGAMFNKWVGESERTMRTALSTAESISPCVLWIDELDKMSPGTGGDGGASARVFGTFLTWLQDRKEGVFVIATANDISHLPPELLRAGRWDDIFFINLPTETERIEIAEVMKKRFKNCESVDTKQIAACSSGYTGAEIEQAFSASLYTRFAEAGGKNGEKNVPTNTVLAELTEIVPLSKLMSERIEALQKWAEGRARSATKKGKSLNAKNNDTVNRTIRLMEEIEAEEERKKEEEEK